MYIVRYAGALTPQEGVRSLSLFKNDIECAVACLILFHQATPAQNRFI
ncbi:hypothetical protein [Plectonema radiosum]|nr:hypothetical protein [Plectonema radiosum]